MGSYLSVKLAYGYYLDGYDGWRFEPDTEELAWLEDDDEFVGKAEDRLLKELTGFETLPYDKPRPGDYYKRMRAAQEIVGVKFYAYGVLDYWYGWTLSAHTIVKSATLVVPDLTVDPEWDIKLNKAIVALGITPTQEAPKWLAVASYG
jgi:hypothetical protein